jgi:hypothetical protein
MGGEKDRDLVDRQHTLISNLINRQSECDFPQGSMRNELIDGTKCQSSKQKGNFYLTIVYCTYNKWKSCYEEIITIL